MGDRVGFSIIDQQFGTVSRVNRFGGYQLVRELIVVVFCKKFCWSCQGLVFLGLSGRCSCFLFLIVTFMWVDHTNDKDRHTVKQDQRECH